MDLSLDKWTFIPEIACLLIDNREPFWEIIACFYLVVRRSAFAAVVIPVDLERVNTTPPFVNIMDSLNPELVSV